MPPATATRCAAIPPTVRPVKIRHLQLQECSRPVSRSFEMFEGDLCQPLEPPPYGRYYIYSSDPKPVRPKYKGSGKFRGAHDYYSMMWEPRIFRGSSFKRPPPNEICVQRHHDIRKKLKRRIPKKSLAPDTSKKDASAQTDKYLAEFTNEVIEKEVCTQTDKPYDMPVEKIFCQAKLGTDADTQIMPWELYSFDDGVRPIVSTVVGKIIEQSLIEIKEESELETLLVQQRVFEERRRIELLRLHRLRLREQKVTAERVDLIAQRQIEVEEEKETQEIVIANLYAASYLCGLAQTSMNELRQFGFLKGNDDLNNSFIPWLSSRSIRNVGIREKSSVFLDEIIQAVVDKKEGEVADGVFREISAENQRMSLHEYEGYYFEEDKEE